MTKVSLKYIAESLNVAKSTVSLVLNGRGDERRIGKDTQDRILKFAKKHNYKADSLARSLSIGKTYTIGLIVPNISDIFFAQIARSIEKEAEKYGYNVIFSSTGESAERESKIIQSMLDRKVDGLIVASSGQNKKEILRLKKNNFPFVLIDRQYPDIETNFVGFDNMQGVASAVEHLIKNGKKRIGFVSLTIGLETIRERLDSYVQTMKKNSLVVEDRFIHEVEYNNIELDMQNVIKDLVKKPCGVEAIVFATQFLTAVGLRQLKALNIRIPDDVAIVSYAQKKDFDLYEPAITSVNLPAKELGDSAVDILLRNMKEEKFNYETVSLKTKLLVRKSCGTK